MEDLVPLIFFLIIVAVNALKFFIEKGGKKKQAPGTSKPRQPASEPPKRTPSSIDKFFENIAEQMAPQPRVVPDSPGSRERPDYIREMAEVEFEQDDELEEELEEERAAEIIPMPAPEPITPTMREIATPPSKVRRIAQPAYAGLSGSHGLRIAGMNSFIQSGARGRNDFRINGKKNLKQAMLAHVIFNPPRAYDLSFDNTLFK
jgi:hypothetical protein